MYREARWSGSSNLFPWLIEDSPDQVFGMIARLLDPKNTYMCSFAVTWKNDTTCNLYLTEVSKNYLYR